VSWGKRDVLGKGMVKGSRFRAGGKEKDQGKPRRTPKIKTPKKKCIYGGNLAISKTVSGETHNKTRTYSLQLEKGELPNRKG